jgi:hypothetical protein
MTTPAEIRLAQYGQRTSTWSTATYDSGTEKALHEIALELKAEIDRLRAEAGRQERLHGDTIDDRDRASDMADKLAYAVAPEEVIGEHTADNSPWANALDLITPKADVDKLRQQITAVTAVHEKGEHNGLPICLHCASQMFPPPETGIWSESAYPCATLQALGVTEDQAAVSSVV